MAEKARWRRHTVEFKRQVVERMKTCQNIHELARELNIERKLLYTWKYQFEGRPEPRHANLGIAAEDRKEQQHREEIAKLKAALADTTLENKFFRSALLKIKADRQQNTASGETASTTPSSRGRKSKASKTHSQR
jgi:transposase-like protein